MSTYLEVDGERSLTDRVAEEVRALMARKRISQVRLAMATGLTQAAISRRITGQVAFDLQDLERISPVLDVTPVQLLGMSESRTTDRYADVVDVAA